jgi:tetratricopeptide (TPR) repeat protein
MNPEAKPTLTQDNAILSVGKSGELVFDDEPLEPLLKGTAPSAPTPASVVEIWRQGIDRSETCVRALISVVANSKQDASLSGNLEGAEECLRQLVSSKCAKSEREYAGCCFALARLLHVKRQFDEAALYYRQALEIQEKALGVDDEATLETARQMVDLLSVTNRKNEAARFRNLMVAQRLAGKEDDSSFWDARQLALDMFLAGQYAEAEEIYGRLLQKRFSAASTHCHLARIFLMTDREVEARKAVDQAWTLRGESPAYVLGRILFLRTLLAMLAGEDWKLNLVELKSAIANRDVHMDWTMQPVLDHLKPRVGDELHMMLTAIVAAIGSRSKTEALYSNPNWSLVCGSNESTEVAESADPKSLATMAPLLAESVDVTSTREFKDADKFSFGKVVKVSSNCLTVKEYDFASDSDVDCTYHLNERYEFGNMTKAEELQPGDSVVLDYIEVNGQRLVIALAKEEGH